VYGKVPPGGKENCPARERIARAYPHEAASVYDALGRPEPDQHTESAVRIVYLDDGGKLLPADEHPPQFFRRTSAASPTTAEFQQRHARRFSSTHGLANRERK
jgi:hypothetical protein